MHLPDGFLDAKIWIPLGAAGAAGVAIALRKIAAPATGDPASPSAITPVVGLAAAFVFAAQMVNFPVATALSGHLLGGTMLAILLGPWMAALVMTAVLVLQALLFQDGGITALGANVVNLAFLSTFTGYGVYRAFLAGADRGAVSQAWSARRAAAVFAGAWSSAVAAALAAAAELGLSRVAPLPSLLALMGGVHALIGVGEGLVSVLVIRSLSAMGYGEAQRGRMHPFASSRHG